MKYSDHVELDDWKGHCLLTVHDAELHDFLEDFFVGQGIEAQIVLPPGRYQLLFPSAISRATVHRLLGQVGIAEIERIVRINSGAPGVDGGA